VDIGWEDTFWLLYAGETEPSRTTPSITTLSRPSDCVDLSWIRFESKKPASKMPEQSTMIASVDGSVLESGDTPPPARGPDKVR